MRRLELTGRRFGRWTVLPQRKRGPGFRKFWLCICACGTRRFVSGTTLRSGCSNSCGCLRDELATTHGMTNSPTHRSWAAMLRRCSNRKVWNFKYYGGRGIRVCRRWRRSFAAFYADMGKRPRGKSIDRRNNDGNYTPKNCRWATRSEQRKNQRRRCH